MYMCLWPPSTISSTTHFATFRPPIVEVVNVNEEGGVGEESQHGGGDEAAGDVGPGLAHKVDNHLSHIRIGNCNHIRLDTTIIIIIYKGHDQQDKVNTADSVFTFLISQNQWLVWSGQRRWSCLVWSLLER